MNALLDRSPVYAAQHQRLDRVLAHDVLDYVFHRNEILSRSTARSCMILDARKLSW